MSDQWKHPIAYLLNVAHRRSGLKLEDIRHGLSGKAMLWRKLVVFVAVEKFLVSVGSVADHLGTEQTTVAALYRKARAVSDREEFFCLANDLYVAAHDQGARPVRANRQQKLERKVSVP